MKYLKPRFHIKSIARQSVEMLQPKKKLQTDIALHAAKKGTVKPDYASHAKHNYLYIMMKPYAIIV